MELNYLGITGVASITLICYGIAFAVKKIGFKSNFIPFLCVFLGMGLGIAAFYLVPNFPANDWLEALAIGFVSGATATSGDQGIKQIRELIEKKEDADDGKN